MPPGLNIDWTKKEFEDLIFLRSSSSDLYSPLTPFNFKKNESLQADCMNFPNFIAEIVGFSLNVVEGINSSGFSSNFTAGIVPEGQSIGRRTKRKTLAGVIVLGLVCRDIICGVVCLAVVVLIVVRRVLRICWVVIGAFESGGWLQIFVGRHLPFQSRFFANIFYFGSTQSQNN